MIKINKQNINQFKDYKYFVIIYTTIDTFNLDMPIEYYSTNNPKKIIKYKKVDNIKIAIHLSNSELIHSEINYWLNLLY